MNITVTEELFVIVTTAFTGWPAETPDGASSRAVMPSTGGWLASPAGTTAGSQASTVLCHPGLPSGQFPDARSLALQVAVVTDGKGVTTLRVGTIVGTPVGEAAKPGQEAGVVQEGVGPTDVVGEGVAMISVAR